eukprot:gene9624-1846_t
MRFRRTLVGAQSLCLLLPVRGWQRLPINMEHPFRWHTEYPLPNKATRVAEALETALEFSQHRATKQSSSDVVFQGDTPAQTFFTWLEHIEQQRGDEQEHVVIEYLELLKAYKQRSCAMREEITTAIRALEELHTYYSSVASQTSAIHLACEKLLQDERELVQQCDAVNSRLGHFKDYDRLRKLINSPTLSVMSDQFLSILSRLDECVTFLAEHTEMFVTRFKHLRNKALSLAHTRITASIQAAMKHQNSNADTVVTDEQTARHVYLLMNQLEKRRKRGEDYANLLNACYGFYFEQRHSVRSNTIQEMIEKNIKEHQANLPSLIRNGCLFMKTLCQEEQIMYGRFFSTMHPGFNNMIDGMTRRFYDAVRPLILQRKQQWRLVKITLNLLENVCLKVMFPFAAVAEELLADIQERLVYRAQNFIDTSIRRYTPTTPDIDYPTRLCLSKKGLSDATVAWYPPITRALTLLSQLYRSLEISVCEGIAQEILEAALHSLDTGFSALRSTKGAFHAELFKIKHLLVLREQIAPFNFSFVMTEVGLDFTVIRDAAVNLLSQTNALFRFDKSNALLSFLLKGASAVTKERIDARKEIDIQLRDVCRNFIEHQVQIMVAPMRQFLLEVKEMPRDQMDKFITTPIGKIDALKNLHTTCQALISKQVEELSKYLQMYLQSSDTEIILFRPMKNGVLEAFRMVQDILSEHYTKQELEMSGWPSLDTISELMILQHNLTERTISTVDKSSDDRSPDNPLSQETTEGVAIIHHQHPVNKFSDNITYDTFNGDGDDGDSSKRREERILESVSIPS